MPVRPGCSGRNERQGWVPPAELPPRPEQRKGEGTLRSPPSARPVAGSSDRKGRRAWRRSWQGRAESIAIQQRGITKQRESSSCRLLVSATCCSGGGDQLMLNKAAYPCSAYRIESYTFYPTSYPQILWLSFVFLSGVSWSSRHCWYDKGPRGALCFKQSLWLRSSYCTRQDSTVSTPCSAFQAFRRV
ncbi:hypothetical protein D9M70_515880 [compost metagenome]